MSRSISPERIIFSMESRCIAEREGSSSSNSAIPIMPETGVRNSWLIVDTNSLFILLASCAAASDTTSFRLSSETFASSISALRMADMSLPTMMMPSVRGEPSTPSLFIADS